MARIVAAVKAVVAKIRSIVERVRPTKHAGCGKVVCIKSAKKSKTAKKTAKPRKVAKKSRK
jgi:hypothetical protein